MILIIFLMTCGGAATTPLFHDQTEVYIDQEVHRKDYTLDFGDHRVAFDQWKKEFAHMYGDSWNEEERFPIFSKTLTEIEHHNWLYHINKSTFSMGLNQFSAMSFDESPRYNNLGNNETEMELSELQDLERVLSDGDTTIPDHIDWRDKGYVTPVKNQGMSCGSCWTFSTTGALEGAYFKKHRKLLSFSEQQILDCCHTGIRCRGCSGGFPSAALNYIQQAGGIETESDYSYEAKKGTCRAKKPLKVGHVARSVKVVPRGNENALKKACAQNGPISVLIDNLKSFQNYHSGIYYDKDCKSDPSYAGHAILVVGYGTSSNGMDYWIIKNSFGTSWGESGFGLMARNMNNACGIANYPVYPIMS